MNLDTQIRSIWIATGVLSGLGLVLAFIQTIFWQSRAGKEIVDLVVSKPHTHTLPFMIGLFYFARLLASFSSI